MVRHVDAIFSQGAFRPIDPLVMPEGTRVHLSVEDSAEVVPSPRIPKIHSPRLANPKDSADFVMKIQGTD